jgi:outer membrane lipoprotein carrier protein
MRRPARTARAVLQMAAGLLALSGHLHAADEAADEELDNTARSPLLDHYLNEVRTLSANFTQTLIDASGEQIEESSGSLLISRPGKFRWTYVEPYEQWLVADGLNLWSYDVDLAQVSVKPQSTALASTPALLLGGSDDVLDEFRYEGDASHGGLTWVRLVPLDTDSGFRHVELGFSGETLARMVFLDNLEQTTVVTLDNVAVNEPVDAEQFQFDVPEDVDVVGTPAEPAGAD